LITQACNPDVCTKAFVDKVWENHGTLMAQMPSPPFLGIPIRMVGMCDTVSTQVGRASGSISHCLVVDVNGIGSTASSSTGAAGAGLNVAGSRGLVISNGTLEDQKGIFVYYTAGGDIVVDANASLSWDPHGSTWDVGLNAGGSLGAGGKLGAGYSNTFWVHRWVCWSPACTTTTYGRKVG
jgi:hypothetical protein